MPEQMRPSSAKQAPDPAVNFDRSDPKREAGQGRLDTNRKATPTARPDRLSDRKITRQEKARQAKESVK